MPPVCRLICAVLISLLGVGVVRAAPLWQEESRIQYGEVIRSRLSETNPKHLWQFEGHSGDLILIDMQASDSESLDTFLTLTDSTETVLLTDDDSGESRNSRIGPVILPADGEYVITASRYTGSGEYTLQLIDLNTVPMIKAGKPLVGVVDRLNRNDYFLFSPEGVSLMRLVVHDNERYSDPFLSLYDLNGYITSTEYLNEGLIDPVVPVPGDIYLVIVSWNWSSRGGSYELLLGASQASLLETGVPQDGQISYPYTSQEHHFRGESGERVRVTVESTGDAVLPGIEIRTADYAQYLFSGEGGTVRQLSVTLDLPRSTVYTIKLGNGVSVQDTISYRVMVERE